MINLKTTVDLLIPDHSTFKYYTTPNGYIYHAFDKARVLPSGTTIQVDPISNNFQKYSDGLEKYFEGTIFLGGTIELNHKYLEFT